LRIFYFFNLLREVQRSAGSLKSDFVSLLFNSQFLQIGARS